MIPIKDLRNARFGRSATTPPSSVKGTGAGRKAAIREDWQDRLSGLTDRLDLEKLYARHIDVGKIVRLMGHEVSREQIDDLAKSTEVDQEIKKILS